jgi:hypothetical protein
MAETDTSTIRAENIQRAVDGFGLMSFKLRQVCKVVRSNAWSESYFQEGSDELSATDTGGGFSVKGVGRLSAFPNLEPTWTKNTAYHVKHAGEHTFSWEDNLASEIDVGSRVLLRVARAIAYSEDLAIYDVITADANVNTAAAEATWDNPVKTLRDPVSDVLHGIEFCGIDNYDVLNNGYIMMNYENYTNLMMNEKVLAHPTTNFGVMQNGVISGRILGLKPLISNAIDADEVCIIKGQEAVTHHILDDLSTEIIRKGGRSWTVSAWMITKTQVKNPEAIHIITNTEE